MERFDPKQRGGCERRWYFTNVEGHEEPPTGAKTDGDKGHDLLAGYLKTGEGPEGRVKMGTAVRAVIAKGKLPTPGPDLLVEWRFSGQPKHIEGTDDWIPLDYSKTFWLGGLPWEGFIDLAYRREDAPTVLDHKFSADIHNNAKKKEDLIKTVQMPIYILALDRLPQFAGAPVWKIAHHNVARSGGESFIRGAVVTRDQVLERKADIKAVLERMKVIARATSQNEVPANKKSCDAWNGCPHQSRCHAFKERTKVELTAEEQALFADLDNVEPAPRPMRQPGDDEEEDTITQSNAALDVINAPVMRQESAKAPDMKADLPPPPTPKPTPTIMPECEACGTDLNPDNASKLRTGAWVHIGCPAKSAPVSGGSAPPPVADPPAPPKAKKAPKAPPVAPAPAENTIQAWAEGEAKRQKDVAAPTIPISELGKAEPGLVTLPRIQIPDSVSATPAPTPGATSSTITIRFEISPETLAAIRSLIK